MDARPRELRASKKLCVLGAALSLMIAAGGAVRAFVVVGSVGAGASGSAATAVVEAEIGAAAEAGTVAEAEANSRSSAAAADGPKNANNMAHAIASFTRAPP